MSIFVIQGGVGMRSAVATAFLCAGTWALPSMACTAFSSVEVPQVRDVAIANGGYEISDIQCQLLQRKGLVLQVIGYSKVLSGTAVSWAEVRLKDPAIGTVSDLAGLSTFANSANGTQAFADQLLLTAIKEAIGRLNFDVAAAQIDNYRAKALANNSASGVKR